MKKEYVLCAAIWYVEGSVATHSPSNIETGFVLTGWRHHNIIGIASHLNIRTASTKHVQGFLTSIGRFVDRNEASTIAYNAGQIDKDVGTLMSEELY